MCRRIFILFLFSFWLFPIIVFADPPSDEDDVSFKDLIINKDIEISNKIDETAKQVDSALSGEPIAKKPNLTHIVLRQLANWELNGPFAYNPYLDVRLDLPNLQRKWQLKFTTYDEDQVDRGINRNRLQTNIRQNYGGDLGFFQKLGNIDTEFQPRFEFQNGFQTSYILKFDSRVNYSQFAFLPELQLFAKSDQGVGEFLALDFNVKLRESFVMSIINEEQYVDQENNFSTNEGLRFSFDSSDITNQMYAVIFESSSRTTYHLDRYTFQYGYTHKLIKNVLHYTLTPYLLYDRTLAFSGRPGVILELDIIL